jgi:hydroxylamine reductase
MSMFCYQCEQTAGCTGCTVQGVCGKDADTSGLQDLLNEVTKGISWYATKAGPCSRDLNLFVIESLFTTITNVNFDQERLADLIRKAVQFRDAAKGCAGDPADAPSCATLEVPNDLAGMVQVAQGQSVASRKERLGDTVGGLHELIFYGAKGTAAYAQHAAVLGKEDDAVYQKFHELLAFVAEESTDLGAILPKALEVGELNLRVMELLDDANTSTYGHPEPTEVRVTPIAGKCILVSGHDLLDLQLLLEQTAGKGINVYTHGEMLPTLAYPELKKHSHLVGNYGGAWQDQKKEFDAFPGSILMTTNCIQRPAETYKARIFTTGLVAWPGVTHIGDSKDFTPVIEAALAADGFAEDAAEEKKITVGFGHNAVMNVAETVIGAVKSGDIKHFFLVGGCDGAKSGRNYYTEFAEKVPQDCVILTLACGKFRFNKLDLGDIGGIPRLLDIGQCNDAYSAIQIAVALAGAFECGVNELPLSFVLSWYEQKAVAILLTLLHLGIQGIRLGPTIPAFLTPDAVGVLVDTFGIAPISTPEEDLATLLA